MEQLLEFASNHPILSLAFVVIVGLLIWTFIAGAAQGVSKLSPGDATRLINHEDAVVLDVRVDGEFNRGHILNAVHIPEKALPEQVSKLDKFRDRPIIATCRTGHRSAGACQTLRKNGFQKVYTLNGGILAWENANLPLTKK